MLKFKNDYIGWAIGVVAIGIAIWTYYASKLKPDLCYSIDPNRAVLVNGESNAIADFTIQYKGSTISRKNVVAATVYLWNAGNAVTHKNQVLVPLKISLPSGAQILDVSILRTSRKICGLQLHPLETLNEYGVDYFIFEPNDGAAIQIIYSGTTDAGIQISGLIEGQDAVHVVATNKLSKGEHRNLFLALRNGHWQFALGLATYMIGFISYAIFVLIRVSNVIRDNHISAIRNEGKTIIHQTRKQPFYKSRRVVFGLSTCLMGIGAILMGYAIWSPFSKIPSSIILGR